MLGPLSDPLFLARSLVGAGIIHLERPDRLIRGLGKLRAWGPTIAGGYQSAAARRPDALALVDERGTLTFREVDERSNRLARALIAEGIGPGDGVAILARNHRYWVDISVAVAKVGGRALYLNTMFAGPQIADVCEREAPVAIVHDEEFGKLVAKAAKKRKRLVAWRDEPGRGDVPTLDEIAAGRPSGSLEPPDEPSRVVILTSGTTGTPKGAQRKQPDSLMPAASLFSVMPLKAREATMIAAPMFHSWGMAHFLLSLSLGSTLVLRRRFDPEDTLAAVAHHRASALVAVPVMLQRIMELPEESLARYDSSSLRVIAVSGSALPGDLATRVMDRFGDVLYNLYGSTEVAWATIASPQDMRAAPGCAGKPPRGTVVRLYDDAGRPVQEGEAGRIFVGNEMAFEGYTGGGGKDVIDGLMSTGDVGHLDADGRLFVDGRDDEMIVSGGENVFPREVEDLLADHPGVVEAAVIGVPDEGWGERLRAFVVLEPGAKAPGEDALKAHVKKNLAAYKVPREVVYLDELPRNATGKVLKRELARD